MMIGIMALSCFMIMACNLLLVVFIVYREQWYHDKVSDISAWMEQASKQTVIQSGRLETICREIKEIGEMYEAWYDDHGNTAVNPGDILAAIEKVEKAVKKERKHK